VSFNVAADAYGRFMGRFSTPLAAELLTLTDLAPGDRVLDVGCGPGALTAQLVDRLGPDAVAAVDPSESFVAAVRSRLPGVSVQQAGAEALPFSDDTFDAAFAGLVVHFMTDPVAGIAEMRRVTRPGGAVAASVWDYEYARSPVSMFWRVVRDLDPSSPGEDLLAGVREGELVDFFARAGLMDVRPVTLTITVPIGSFEDWWEPYTLGVGPAGAYVAGLDEAGRETLREHCRRVVPAGPFEIEAAAWAAVGHS
jgi:SAM-dependent methyltransferase